MITSKVWLKSKKKEKNEENTGRKFRKCKKRRRTMKNCEMKMVTEWKVW